MSIMTKTIIEHMHKNGSDITIVEHPASVDLQQAFLQLEESEQIHFLLALAEIRYEPNRAEEIIFHANEPEKISVSAVDISLMIANAKALAAADDADASDDADEGLDAASQLPN